MSRVTPLEQLSVSDVVANPVLAEVIRSGFVESRHRGSIVALTHDGLFAFTAGSANTPVYPRSANKPLQAAAMLRVGLPLEGELLALAAASHSGEDYHARGVNDILDTAGLTAEDLQCPPALPIDEATARRLIRETPDGVAPESRVLYNCSGKHAAMLVTCIVNDWPTETYRSPEHPLQVHIRRTIEELAREPIAAVGVDGCGAPLFALTLGGLARAFRALVLAEPGSPERKVADAMRKFPEWTSGTTRDENKLMTAIPGLLLKGGAEGVDAFALPDGTAAAVKIDDGNARARTPVSVAILAMLGAQPPVELATAEVTGGGQQVGVIRATRLS
ncbi:asparaginase [Trebonia kvetii]|uniref:Asparaginase n=1 Tax=Trebonia kvetii TaxID=2480626 RepID=A0A6P2BRZ9_9ACTN|nr:asparaginase [Trebonia kvetii]